MNRPLPVIDAQRFPQIAYEGGATLGANDADNLVSMRDLLRVLRVYWRLIVAGALAAALLGMVVVSQITPIYLGRALVMVDEQRNHVFNQQTDPTVLSDLPSDPSSIDSQVQMLQSHALAAQVVDK